MTHTASVVPIAPIACTLSPGAHDQRVAWIAVLNRTLVHHAQRELTLELHYPATQTGRVRELVRREQACCAFLNFDVAASPTGVVLRISAPAETRDAVENIFAPFLSGVGAATPAPMTESNGARPTDYATACGSSGSPTCDTGPAAPCGCAPSTGPSVDVANPRSASADLDSSSSVDSSGPKRATRAGAMTTAGLAVACGVCCLLPFALPAVALTAFGGVVATMASAYRWTVVVAVGAVLTGWAWVLWQSVRSHRAPARSTLRAMVVATTLLVVALAWPTFERSIIAWLRA